MPDPVKLLHTLERAVTAFRTTSGRQGRFVELSGVDEVIVAGDLHGNLTNFKRLLEVATLDRHPGRHLVVQEIIHGPHRYPKDGGDQSHRLLDLVAALKCQYQNRVHVLLGNHELSQWTQRAIIKNDEDLNQLFRRGVDTAYGSQGGAVYAAYERLFAVMPVALRTPNRVFLSHSLAGASRLGRWELAQLFTDEHDDEDMKIGGCIHAVVWGRDTSPATVAAYLNKVEADLLISGHIPCERGYQLPNSQQLILDAKDEYGCACLFKCTQPVSQEDLIKGIIWLQKQPDEAQDSSASVR